MIVLIADIAAIRGSHEDHQQRAQAIIDALPRGEVLRELPRRKPSRRKAKRNQC